MKSTLAALKQFLSAVLAAAFLVGLSGCATMEGMGEDVEEVGEEIQEHADH